MFKWLKKKLGVMTCDDMRLELKEVLGIFNWFHVKMKAPDKITLKDTEDKDEYIVSLYGIEFREDQWGSKYRKPLKDIAEKLKIHIDYLHKILRDKGFLDEKNMAKKTIFIGESPFPRIVVANVLELKKDSVQKDRKYPDCFEPERVWGNVEFITKLMDQYSESSGDFMHHTTNYYCPPAKY